MRLLFVIAAITTLMGCSAPKHYAQDTMSRYFDQDYDIFCDSMDPRCFGDTPASDKIHDPYNFLRGFPEFGGPRPYFVSFSIEGSGVISRIDHINSIWITPAEGENARIFRFTQHYQQPDTLKGYKFNLQLHGTAPIGSDTPVLYRKAIDRMTKLLVNRPIRYRCFGLTQNMMADCYVLINDQLDLGEWLIKNGYLGPYGPVATRYTEAFDYSATHQMGFNAPSEERLAATFPGWRKDRYGVCWKVSELGNQELKGFYSTYTDLEDCLTSGGILPNHQRFGDE